MPKCKQCGTILRPQDIRKSWNLKGRIKDPKTGKTIIHRIDLYDCPNCLKTTRTATRI